MCFSGTNTIHKSDIYALRFFTHFLIILVKDILWWMMFVFDNLNIKFHLIWSIVSIFVNT